MKYYTFIFIMASILLMSCQKSPANLPEDLNAAKVESTTPRDTETSNDDNQLQGQTHAINSPMARSFDEFGLDIDQLKPTTFSFKQTDKNGSFSLTKPGNFRYFVIKEPNYSLNEQQFADYCRQVAEHAKSIADNNSLFAYNINTGEIGNKLDPIPQAMLDQPFQFTYQFNSQAVSVYIAYKNYQPGLLANENSAVNAIYLGIFEEFTGDND